MKTKEIEEKYNITNRTIIKWVKEGKLTLPATWKKGLPYDIDEQQLLQIKKYYWNDKAHQSYQIGWNRDIFKNIDTPEKAYWLGFINADGCLHFTSQTMKQGHLSIDISGEDSKHLEKFANFIEAQQPIIQYTKHPDTGNILCHIQISCSSTLHDLYNLGIAPRKSGKEQWIDTAYPKDFIRGYIDGDGYIRQDYSGIGCVGGYDILNKIQQYFTNEFKLKPHKIQKHEKIFRIEYRSKKDIKIIAEQLWYSGCISLNRKQLLIDEIKKLS